MRNYWLESEITKEKWDLGIYGLTPFFPTKRGHTRNYKYTSANQFIFIPNGEDEKQQTFSGTLVFKGDSTKSSDQRFREFMKYIGRNTTKDFLDINDYVFHGLITKQTLTSNVVRRMRLYSKDGTNEARFAYAVLSSVNSINEVGQDTITSVTFILTSLWMVYHEVSLESITGWDGTSKNETNVNKGYSYTITDFGDVDPTIGVYAYTGFSSMSKTSVSALKIQGANGYVQMNYPMHLNNVYNQTGAIYFGEKFGSYEIAYSVWGDTSLSNEGDVYNGYEKLVSGSLARITANPFKPTLVIQTLAYSGGKIFWFDKYFED